MSILTSFKTTTLGIFVIICNGVGYEWIIPPPYGQILQLVCGVLMGVGLIAAKDYDKTHASVPLPVARPAPVPTSPPPTV